MQETSKALIRRLQDARYTNTYFKGEGIDIGCGLRYQVASVDVKYAQTAS